MLHGVPVALDTNPLLHPPCLPHHLPQNGLLFSIPVVLDTDPTLLPNLVSPLHAPHCHRTAFLWCWTLTPLPCLPHHLSQNGLLFGIPVVLDTDREDITVGDKVLVTYQGQNIAVVTIESKWTPNKPLECLKVYGTSSLEHPAVQVGGVAGLCEGVGVGAGLRGG